MEIAAVNNDNLPFFKNLMLDEVYGLLAQGEPVPAIGLADGQVACGAVAGCVNDYAFYISSLFVAPDYRGKGGGALLLEALKSILKEFGNVYEIRAEYTISEEDHMLLKPFFEKMGFIFEEDELAIYTTTLDEVSKSAFFSSAANKASGSILPFAEIPEIYIRLLGRGMKEWEGKLLFSSPLEKAELDRDLSIGYVEDGRIAAYILFDFSFENKLTLAYAYSGTNISAGSGLFAAMLRAAFKQAVKKYPPNTAIVINAGTTLSAALVKKLTGKKRSDEILSRSCVLRLEE